MAIRYAVANGNWSSTATWDGGTTLPGSTDDVYANNFTVNIDQSITVNSLKKISNGSPAISAGGGFVITAAATVTITAGIVAADNVTNSTSLVTLNTGSFTASIVGSVAGGAGTGRVGVTVASGFTGTLGITGALTGGSSASNTYALSITGVGATIDVTGDVTGGANAAAVSLSAASTLSVTGAVLGGSNGAAPGITQSSGALTVRGTLRPGPGTGNAGVVAVSATGTAFRYSGNIYSGGMVPSTGTNGFFPIAGAWSAITGEEVYVHVYDDGNFPSGNNGTARVLTRYGTDNPDAADVRSGVTYGASGANTGTLAVPPPASVAAGVPTDDTVGTAALVLSDVASVTGAQIAAALS